MTRSYDKYYSVLFEKQYPAVMHLKLFVDSDDELLQEKYIEAIERHNASLLQNDYIDAGFDLFCPSPSRSVATYFEMNKYPFFGMDFIYEGQGAPTNWVDFQVKCEASIFTHDGLQYPTAFELHMRSSLSKTPLRLANNVGIVDAGYRGNLIGAFDVIEHKDTRLSKDLRPDSLYAYSVEPYTRLLQICAPQKLPIFVELVYNNTYLSGTERGEGGFGSTGV